MFSSSERFSGLTSCFYASTEIFESYVLTKSSLSWVIIIGCYFI